MLWRARGVAALLLIAAVCLGLPQPAGAQQAGDPSRVKALIVGVPKYPELGDKEDLPRAKADAEGLDTLLRKQGVPPANVKFIADNATRERVAKAWKDHLDSLKPGDVSIFFFSGHGQERDREQALLLADFNARRRGGSIALPSLVQGLEAKSRNLLGIFIVDACRNEVKGGKPDDADLRPAASAIVEDLETAAPVRAAEGTFIFYSASPRQVALHDLGPGDGSAYSVYSRVLLKLLAAPGRGLHDVAKEARWETYQLALERRGPDGKVARHVQVPAYFDDSLQRRNLLGGVIAQARLSIPNDGKPGALGPKGIKGFDWPCESCPELVLVPAPAAPLPAPGSAPGSAPVPIAKPFYIGKYEVTREEWRVCQVAKACREVDAGIIEGDRHPISGVTYADAEAYVKWLSSQEGLGGFRLPTEVEWEHAARGGSSSGLGPAESVRELCEFANGADASLKTLVWANPLCNDGKGRGTTSVGSYRPNGYGVHDMQGNVWEWVDACLDAPACTGRIAKGGSWRSGPDALRIGSFQSFPATLAKATVGFRVARDAE